MAFIFQRSQSKHVNFLQNTFLNVQISTGVDFSEFVHVIRIQISLNQSFYAKICAVAKHGKGPFLLNRARLPSGKQLFKFRICT